MFAVVKVAWTLEQKQHNKRNMNTSCQRKERLIIWRLDWNSDRRKDTKRMVNDTIVNEWAKMESATLTNLLVGSVADRDPAVVNAVENVPASQSLHDVVLSEYLPATQSKQVAPAAEILPLASGGQDVPSVAGAAQNFLPAHAWQRSASFVAMYFSGSSVKQRDPDSNIFTAAQALHASSVMPPEVSKNCLAPQPTHVELKV